MLPAGVHWGVDSAGEVHKPAKQNHKQTVFEYVSEQLGQAPEFWGRYIWGKFRMSDEEVDYIFDQNDGNTRILPIYNGTSATLQYGRNTYEDGKRDGRTAIECAAKLGIPADNNVMIWADIEGKWVPSAEWFEGWWDTMFDSKYAGLGGIYHNPKIPHFYKPFYQALKQSLADYAPGIINPFAPPAKNVTPAIKAKELQQPLPVRDPAGHMRYLWSTEPRPQHHTHRPFYPRDLSTEWDPSKQQPMEPMNCPGRTVLWQYRFEDLGLVDQDLCDDRAYDLMWSLDKNRIINPFDN